MHHNSSTISTSTSNTAASTSGLTTSTMAKAMSNSARSYLIDGDDDDDFVYDDYDEDIARQDIDAVLDEEEHNKETLTLPPMHISESSHKTYPKNTINKCQSSAIDYTSGLINVLPEEMIMHIMSYLEPNSVFNFACSHGRYWTMFCSPRDFGREHLWVRMKKNYLPLKTPKDHVVDKNVRQCIKKVMELAPHFVHEYNTCLNESLNNSRTVDAPKAVFFSSTYALRAWPCVARWNLGGQGAFLSAVWRELGLAISELQLQHWNAIDTAHQKARARQSLQATHARALELNKEHGLRRKQEKLISKQRKDQYYTGAQKSAFNTVAPSTVLSARHATFNPATVTSSTCVGLNDKQLKAVLKHHGETQVRTGEIAEQRRTRLQLFLVLKESTKRNAAEDTSSAGQPHHLPSDAPVPLAITDVLPVDAASPSPLVPVDNNQKRGSTNVASTPATRPKKRSHLLNLSPSTTTATEPKKRGRPPKSFSSTTAESPTAKRRRIQEVAHDSTQAMCVK